MVAFVPQTLSFGTKKSPGCMEIPPNSLPLTGYGKSRATLVYPFLC